MENDSKKDILKTITRQAQAGEWDKVIKGYEELLSRDPDDISLHNSLGDAYAKTDEHRKAFEHYLKVLEDYQKTKQIAKINFLYKKISKLNPRKFDLEGKALHDKLTSIVNALALYDREDYDEAIPALKEAIKHDSFNMDLFMRLGDACERKMLIGDAVEAYVKLLRILVEKQMFEEAFAAAEKILSLDKENVDAKGILAESYIIKGDKEKGQQAFSEILAHIKEKNLIPQGKEVAKRAMDYSLQVGREYYAYFLFKDNKIEEAKKVLADAYDLTLNEKILLGKLHFKTLDYDKAKEIFMSLSPEIIQDNVEINELLGDIYLKLREHKKSAGYYFTAVKLLLNQNMLDAALSMSNKVINVDSDNVEVHEILANIYLKKGMKNNLIDEYTRLAAIYDKVNRKEDAFKVRQLLNKLKMI